MLPYHQAFWAVAAISSILLGLGLLAVALVTARSSRHRQAAGACLLTLVAGTALTIALTCLGLRRDFVRPLPMVVVVALTFMGMLALMVGETIALGKRSSDD